MRVKLQGQIEIGRGKIGPHLLRDVKFGISGLPEKEVKIRLSPLVRMMRSGSGKNELCNGQKKFARSILWVDLALFHRLGHVNYGLENPWRPP